MEEKTKKGHNTDTMAHKTIQATTTVTTLSIQ